MVRDYLMRNKIAIAFALGAVYIGAYMALVALLDAQDDENDRMTALRWQNNRLIERLAAYTSSAPNSSSEQGGPQ